MTSLPPGAGDAPRDVPSSHARGRTTAASEQTDWHDRTIQPRCNICGRFAYWYDLDQRWRFGCIGSDGEGGYEHD